MRIKLFTKSHNIDLLKEIDNNGGQFTFEEHAYVVEKEFADKFESKEKLLHWYFSSGNTTKLSALGFLMKYANDNRFINIVSFGAGCCVLEYLLKYGLPSESKVVAADFDPYLIKKAKELLLGIIPVTFDFFKDDVKEIQDKIQPARIDLAVFFGSSYVMDDTTFISLFKRLKEIGIKQIIDFHAGYIDFEKFVYFITIILKECKYIRRIFRKFPIVKGYQGKFHGYARTRNEIRRLYKKANLNLIKEISVEPYKYVTILDLKNK